jgi:hypothetical protein
VFHHASPIKMGGKRLVFCMFYSCDESIDLSHEKSPLRVDKLMED